jgi:hypothetical protein
LSVANLGTRVEFHHWLFYCGCGLILVCFHISRGVNVKSEQQYYGRDKAGGDDDLIVKRADNSFHACFTLAHQVTPEATSRCCFRQDPLHQLHMAASCTACKVVSRTPMQPQ